MGVITFADDLFGLESFCKRLEKFIDTEHQFVDGGLVLALSAKYGTGKTTFLNMWRSALIAEDKNRIVVSLNAWESDYIGDPLFSIISALTHTFSDAGQDANRVIEAAKDIGWFATAAGAQIVAKVSGFDAIDAGEFAEGKKQARRKPSVISSDAFTAFEKRKAGMDALKNAIKDLIGSSTPSVLFLVDELDRCRPDYAITYLETIKHIFDISGAVFILAADRDQLENSAKTAFGQGLDFDEYYRKFIHREITLPPIAPESYRRIVNNYVSYYLVDKGQRTCLLDLGESQIKNLSDLIINLKLTPRQIQEVFRTLGHLCESSDKTKKDKLHWCIGVGSLAMAIFKVGAPKIYHLLGNNHLDFQQAAAFFKTADKSSIAWWLAILYTGDGLQISENIDFDNLMKEHSVPHNMPSDYMNEFRRGWGYGSSHRFAEIYKKIQQIDQWK